MSEGVYTLPSSTFTQRVARSESHTTSPLWQRIRAVACVPPMSGNWGPGNAANFGLVQQPDQSAAWSQQPDYSDTHLMTAVGAVLCAIWTFLPWVTISESDVIQSADGMHGPPDCLEVCSSAPMSTWGLLLAVVAALTAAGCFIRLSTRRRAFVHAVAVGPPWDDLSWHKHYLYGYMQFTVPQSPYRQPPDPELDGP